MIINATPTCCDFWGAACLFIFLVAGRSRKPWISCRPIQSVLLAHTKLQQNVGHTVTDLLEKPWYLTYGTNFASSIEPECSLRCSKNPCTQTPCVTFNIMLNFFYGDFLLPSIHHLNPRTTLKVNKRELLFHCYTNIHTIKSRDFHFKYRLYVFSDMRIGTLGLAREETRGEWRQLRNEEFHNLCFSQILY